MILVAGLTPAWQRVMRFDRFTPGGVNRADETHACASGKALNVAVALHQLGAPVRVVSPAGTGPVGRAIREDLEATGVEARWVESGAPARTCTTLITPDGVTELVENAAPILEFVVLEFTGAFLEAAADAKLIVLTGSLPPGAPKEFYARLVKAAPCPVILDAQGPELLAALGEKPFLVKPNRAELETTGLTAAQIRAKGPEWVVVTDGGGPVTVTGSESFTARPRKVKVANPIGCGDAFAAGMAKSLLKSRDLRRAVKAGLDAAARSAATLLPGRL